MILTKITLGALSTLMASQALIMTPESDKQNSNLDQVPLSETEGTLDSYDLNDYITFIETSDLPENIKEMLLDAINNNLTAEQLKEKYKNSLSASDLELLNEIISEPSERGLASFALKIVLKFVKKYGVKAACAAFSIQGAHYILYNMCKAAGWW